jgi:PAS domain S-box-containing protein
MHALPQSRREAKAHEAAFTFDADFAVTGWDAGAERLFGWTADEATGRRMWDVLPGDGDRMGRLRDLRTAGTWAGVVVVADKHNQHVAVDARVVADRDAAGDITGYRATLRELPEPEAYRRLR